MPIECLDNVIATSTGSAKEYAEKLKEDYLNSIGEAKRKKGAKFDEAKFSDEMLLKAHSKLETELNKKVKSNEGLPKLNDSKNTRKQELATAIEAEYNAKIEAKKAELQKLKQRESNIANTTNTNPNGKDNKAKTEAESRQGDVLTPNETVGGNSPANQTDKGEPENISKPIDLSIETTEPKPIVAEAKGSASKDEQPSEVKKVDGGSVGVGGDKGVPFIKKIFDKIRSIAKLNKIQHNILFNIDTKLSKEIADAYEKMKHDPNNPKVKKAYEAMVEETKQQYNALVDGGLKAERWTGEGEPYANSAEMLNDLKENNHLWFLPNESAFGDKGAATKYKDNIGLQDSGITLDGKSLTNSEVFRIVHDAVHGINGNEFGAIGEENATLQHLSMYSDEALPAVVAQTRGQNSWVNFSGVNDSANAKFKEAAKLEKEGKYDEAKKIRKEAQKEFTFAEPKIGLLPNKYNFRYYGTKNSELASKEKSNTRSGEGNTKESKPINALTDEKNLARESQSFSSRSNSGGRTIRTSYGDVVPKFIHTIKQSLVQGIKNVFPDATIDKELFEVDADIFHKAATKAKSVNKFGAAVDVLTQEEYSKYRLFITEDGLTGIALSKDGDLGSGFDMSGKPKRLPQLLVLGIENGATHANAFDTILPDYYSAFGFKPVARNLWNDALKPKDWNYTTFEKWNNGRPDVVHFVWDGGNRNTIHERIGQFDNYNDYHKEQTPIIDTWEEAQEIVEQSLKETTKAETPKENQQPTKEVLPSSIDKGEAVDNIDKGIPKETTNVGEVKVEPIRQLGTGDNVYFESKGYRVNDSKNGEVLLIIRDENEKEPFPITSVKFDNVNEAVFIANKLNENRPNGLTPHYDIDKLIENLKEEYKNNNNGNEQQIKSDNLDANGNIRKEPTNKEELAQVENEIADHQKELDKQDSKSGIKKNVLPIKDIVVAPKTFQFKTQDEENGVNRHEKLDGKYDRNIGGSIGVWIDAKNELGNGEGKVYVVDGHHRMDLAKRSGEQNIDVFYIDAPTAKEARLVGAKSNIAQGRGTAIDAAKIYRDATPLQLENFSPKSKVGKEGKELAKLSQPIFDLVAQEKLDIQKAIAIAQVSEAKQEAFYKAIKRIEDSGAIKMSSKGLMVMAEKINSGEVASNKVKQVDLFGTSEKEELLLAEQSQLEADIKDDLSKDAKILGNANKNKEVLEKANNVVNVDENNKLAEQSKTASALYDTYKKRNSVASIIKQATEDLSKAPDRKTKQAIREKASADVKSAIQKELNIDFGKEDLNLQQVISPLIDKAKTALDKAQRELDNKRNELDKNIQGDNQDLFGKAKNNDNALFDNKADASQREKVLEPYKKAVENARESYNKAVENERNKPKQLGVFETPINTEEGGVKNEQTDKQKAKDKLDEARLAFRKSGGLSSGGLESLPELIDLVRAYADYGYESVKEAWNKFKNDFPESKLGQDVFEKYYNEAVLANEKKIPIQKEISKEVAIIKTNDSTEEEIRDYLDYMGYEKEDIDTYFDSIKTQEQKVESGSGQEPPKVEDVNNNDTGDGYRGISKAYLKKHDDYVKTFETRDRKDVADQAMKALAQRAENNGVKVEEQAENEVESIIKRGIGSSHENEIITVAYHLSDLDSRIEKEMAKDDTDNAQLDLLLNKKQQALEASRILGHSTGSNLNLFGYLFKKIASDNISTYRAQIQSIFDVADLPKTVKDLQKSLADKKISTTDYDKILPFVTEIEKVTKQAKERKAISDSKIKDIKDKAVQKYIENEIKKGVTNISDLTIETNTSKPKSTRTKDVIKSELDKARAQFRIDAKQMSSGGLQAVGSFVKVVKLAVEYGIKSASEFIKEFKDDFEGHSEVDITKAFNRVLVAEKKNDAIVKISEIAKNENAKEITANMVDAGLINHVINDYIHSDTPYDKVISEATKELQQHLPETTEKQVRDAILRDGEFKQKTKKQLENEVAKKASEVRRLAHTQSTVDGIENANDILRDTKNLSDKEKKAEIEKRKSEHEKELDAKIKAWQKEKAEAGKFYGESYSGETRIERMEDELQRLKDRKEKEPNETVKRQLSDREKTLKESIDAERKAWQKEKAEARNTPENRLERAKEAVRKRIEKIRTEIAEKKRESTESTPTLHKDVELERLEAVEKSLVELEDKYIPKEPEQWKDEKALKKRRQNLENDISELNDQINKGERNKKDDSVEDTEQIRKLRDIKNAKQDLLDEVAPDIEKINREEARKEEKLKLRLADIDEQINHLKNEKTVFNEALKNPIKGDERLKQAKDLLAKAYHEAGIRKETSSKNEIKIAQDADAEIKTINESDLSDEIKKEHIKAIEKARDAELNNTKQGVLSNLRDNVGRLLKQIIDYSAFNRNADIEDIKQSLGILHSALKPNVENLGDQINKAYQDLTAIIKEHRGTEFEDDLRAIQDKYIATWQKTSDELQRQSLIDKAQSSLRESERRLNAGQYTEIPTEPYQAEVDHELSSIEAENTNAWAKLNSLKRKAVEENRDNLIDKLNNARRAWLIMSFGALEKVGVSAISKPILDPLHKQLFGRITGQITGVKPTSLDLLHQTYKQFTSQENADAFMNKKNNEYVNSVAEYSKAIRDFGIDSKEAEKAHNGMMQKELEMSASLANLFLNANSLIDIKQVLINAATNLDASLGKYDQSFHEERVANRADKNQFQKVLDESKYWVESVNRSHSAMKSISARQGLLDGYIENLQYFQKKDGRITDVNRKLAWDRAVLSEYEIGRFGEKTQMSQWIGKLKQSENPFKRAGANYALPVAKIAINITKQGIDRALPLELAIRTLGADAMKGMKFNEEDGIQFKTGLGKYYNGIKRGFEELPYEQKKYINTLMSRGLSGVAQYALVFALLGSGNIKYGGAWNDNDPFHRKYGVVMGSDGRELKNGEWEIFGERMPKVVNVALNHSPYTLPASIAADMHFQLNRVDKKGNPIANSVLHAGQAGINEAYSRLPFTTFMDLLKIGIGGDDYKAQKLVSGLVPGAKNIAEYFDKNEKGETVDRQARTTAEMIMKDNPFLRPFLKEKGSFELTPTQTKGLSELKIKPEDLSKKSREELDALKYIDEDGIKHDIFGGSKSFKIYNQLHPTKEGTKFLEKIELDNDLKEKLSTLGYDEIHNNNIEQAIKDLQTKQDSYKAKSGDNIGRPVGAQNLKSYNQYDTIIRYLKSKKFGLIK